MEYDPAADTWKAIAKLTAKRTAGAAVEVRRQDLFHRRLERSHRTGRQQVQNAGLVVGTNEAFDPATNRWETRKPMPTPRNHPAIGVVGGKIYRHRRPHHREQHRRLHGRQRRRRRGIQPGDRFVAGDEPDADRAQRPGMERPTRGRSTSPGGEQRDYHIEGSLRDVEVFDPAVNDWYAFPSMPTARAMASTCAAYNGKLFVIGGHLVFAGGGGHAARCGE